MASGPSKSKSDAVAAAAASAVAKPSRNIPPTTRLFLYVKAGGRCEFDGCNDYLLEHHVTKAGGNFAEMAHIFAFSDGGPRADAERGPEDVHDISNLMLLCPVCHTLIDGRPGEFTVEVLRKHKKAHEDRVFLLTDTKPDRETIVVALRGRVAGKPVTITLPEIQAAVAPRYVGARGIHDIDLTAFNDAPTPEFWKMGEDTIRKQMGRFYETRFDGHTPHHVSVFGLAPIPLLMVLGSTLSDKVPTAHYQRHRDSESWAWKTEGQVVEFATTKVRSGAEPSLVALVLSVSGVIALSGLPAHVDDRYTVYSLAPTNTTPDRKILDVEASFQAFRSEYLRAMRLIVQEQPAARSIDVFPAVPAPAAVAMGRDLLPKRDPVLAIYDFNKANGGFVRALEINRDE